jgi:hypothetical protein
MGRRKEYMSGLTYSLVYSPGRGEGPVTESGIDFLCADGKVHVRLRDYDREETISGFVGKLTYLITYLANYAGGRDGSRFLSEDDAIRWVERKVNEEWELGDTLRAGLRRGDFAGVSIARNFRRVPGHSALGSMGKELCPYSSAGECSERLFASALGISIGEFLFDDAYEISIHRKREPHPYSKYLNKARRKTAATCRPVADRAVRLW